MRATKSSAGQSVKSRTVSSISLTQKRTSRIGSKLHTGPWMRQSLSLLARRPSMSAGTGSRTWCRFPRLPSNISGEGNSRCALANGISCSTRYFRDCSWRGRGERICRFPLNLRPRLRLAGFKSPTGSRYSTILRPAYAQRQSLCDKQELKIQQLLDQIKELETQFAIAREQAPSLEKPLSTRERDSLLKLVIGMAVGGYGYVPTANRSEQPAMIEADLARLGLSLDVDTIRKWLKRGAEFLPPEAE